MEVLILLVFVGLALVAAAFVGFAWSVRIGSLDHSERLALLPLERDAAAPSPVATAGTNRESASSAR